MPCGCSSGPDKPRTLQPPKHFVQPGQRGFYPDQPPPEKPPHLGRKTGVVPQKEHLGPTVVPLHPRTEDPGKPSDPLDRAKGPASARFPNGPVNFPRSPEQRRQQQQQQKRKKDLESDPYLDVRLPRDDSNK